MEGLRLGSVKVRVFGKVLCGDTMWVNWTERAYEKIPQERVKQSSICLLACFWFYFWLFLQPPLPLRMSLLRQMIAVGVSVHVFVHAAATGWTDEWTD